MIMKFWDLFQFDDEPDDEVLKREFAQMEQSMRGLFGQQRRLFACDCVEHALAVFEKQFPDDDRPRNAITAARRFVFGIATSPELSAAHQAVAAAYDELTSKAPKESGENWPPLFVVEAALICCGPDTSGVDPIEVCRYVLGAVESTPGQALKENRWQYGRLMWYLKHSASAIPPFHHGR